MAEAQASLQTSAGWVRCPAASTSSSRHPKAVIASAATSVPSSATVSATADQTSGMFCSAQPGPRAWSEGE
ncbi:hypothetical protein ACWDKQ_25380 [Saccharopolyspora sp. NPDC000995]